MSKPRFDTAKFEASHCRKPRGRGNWAFEAGGRMFWAQGTFTEARKQAAKFFADEFVVRVMP